MRIRVKICGITSIEDATASVMAGADALGFVIWGGSKRYLGPPSVKKIVEVLPPFVSTVGVFVNETEKSIMRTVKETSINTVQLHGEEKPSL
ncbi:MAG: N-(5'-phosphoribosyl)anthranilate isomerase, partial [Deltaproteobacteria bacterium]|nr:N-(5'-phosphoribosyl)anthranilate isomerase [Deltaproteobacteria bacterium]